MADAPVRILMVGPVPPPIGGTTVAFQMLVEHLRSSGAADVRVVNTVGVRGRGAAGASRFIEIRRDVRSGARWADVVALHAATSGLAVMGPVVALAARRCGRPLIVRKFAGKDHADYGFPRANIIDWSIRRADLYLVETRELVETATRAGVDHVQWFPNSRPMPELGLSGDSRECRRFVYLGQLWRRKGIPEIVSAGERLGPEFTVDVYGTLGHDVSASDFDGLSRVRYRGEIEPGLGAVNRVLCGYDALLLPSTMETEGYPGVVFEAYAAGLPVVCTRWRSLPDLVDETSGLLVEPGDADDLLRAMNLLAGDRELFRRLRDGVRLKRVQFSSKLWGDRFLELAKRLASGDLDDLESRLESR